MNLVDKVNIMQGWLVKLSSIKKERALKKIDDIDAYNRINNIIEEHKAELENIELYDVYEYAREYFLLRIQ